MWDSLATCEAEPALQNAIRVRVPSGIRSKQKLLGMFAKQLRFPRYFGWNWDALEECLHDLSWLPAEQPILVIHEALPFSESDNRRTYLAILQSWQANSPRIIRICLSGS